MVTQTQTITETPPTYIGTPSAIQQLRERGVKGTFITRRPGTGLGGVRRRTKEEEIAQARAREQQRKEQLGGDIRKEFLEASASVRTDYQKSLRAGLSIQERQNLLNEMNVKISEAQHISQFKRVEGGLIASYTIPGTQTRVTPDIARDLIKLHEGKEISPMAGARLEQMGLAQKPMEVRVTDIPPEYIGKTPPDERHWTEKLWGEVKKRIVTPAEQYFKTVRQPIFGLAGSELLKPLPLKSTMELPPSLLERARRKIVYPIRERYAEYFEPGIEEKYQWEPITPSKLFADIPQAIAFTTIPGIAKKVGEVAEFITPEYTYPEEKVFIPTRVTYTPEYPGTRITIPERELKKEVREAVEFGTGIAPYAFIPSGALLVGGLGLALGPEEPYRLPEHRVGGAILAGFGAVGLGIKHVPKLGKKVYYRRADPFYVREVTDIIQPITKKGRMIEKAWFKLKRVTPPTEAMATTGWRQLLRRKPKIPWGAIEKPKIRAVWTPEEIFIAKGRVLPPASFLEKRVGAKYATIYEYVAKAEKMSLKEFSQLPKSVQKSLQKFAETKSATKVVAMKNVPKILGEDIEYYMGVLGTKRIARIKPIKDGLEFWKPSTWKLGKATREFEAVSLVKKLPTRKEIPIEAFTTLTGVKETTKPFWRVGKDIEKIPGLTLRMKPKDITPTFSLGLKHKPPTKTIAAYETLITAAKKTMPKVPKFKTPIPKTLPTYITAPTYVGGLGKGVSDWYGKRVSVKGISDIEFIPSQKLLGITKPSLIPITAPKFFGAVRTKDLLKTKELLKVKEMLKVAPKTIMKFKVKELLKSKVALKTALKLKLKVKPITKPTTIPRIIPRLISPKIIPKPKIPIPIPIPKPSDLVKLRRPIKRVRRPITKAFEVIVKKKGKFVKVSPFPLIKGEALWLGRRIAKAGAVAQFRLIPVKKKARPFGIPKISEKALLPEFRKPIIKGKEIKDPFTFIQRRAFRIKTPGELREITYKGIAVRRGRRLKW